VPLHQPAICLPSMGHIFPSNDQRPRSWWPAAVMASSARRGFIGHLVFAKAAKAGGNQTAVSRPPQTATHMIR
jgi:hypothetical protein